MASSSPESVVAVCVKRVRLAVEVDPLTGEVHAGEHAAGLSNADEAALEWAVRLAEAAGAHLRAVTVGPPAADDVLRQALAAGADEAVRIEPAGAASSATTARLLAGELADAAVCCCGDASLDGGTGAVPAFLAGELAAAQALGLVALDLAPAEPPPGRGRALRLALVAERRLDQGRRERLDPGYPCVLSFEGQTARLRRAPLAALLAARSAEIRLVRAPALDDPGTGELERTAAFRPRTRVVAAPPAALTTLDRILVLTGSLAERPPARTLRLEPDEAAEVLLEALEGWGAWP